ncbi:UPF0149 family protein [Pseudorhodoferax sp. Leaf267]|uniref:UPF0149 family protein n=1 Tax=Pseudorhodoferax sp. Leaf267 TaxID=1736316 RepID=UPI000A9F9430|nr:UPF0149 family protein [Pseudorhodoferax sp. Leaf267]
MPVASPLQPADFDELDALLDGLRERSPQVPQWEFCEGFMAALVCCRSPILPAEYWPVLLDSEDSLSTLFADAARQQRFERLWGQRWQEIAAGLDAEVDSLDDERAYCPQVLDVRGAIAAMPADERAQALGQAGVDEADADPELPAFAQVWALGFMLAVETWPDEWTAPARDKEAARWLEEAMAALADLCEDDEGPAEVSAFETEDGQDGPPSMSSARLEAFGEAVWAVYDLRQMGRTLGPRVVQVRRDAAAPGRNDLCPCGSGKKFKKCHGAG